LPFGGVAVTPAEYNRMKVKRKKAYNLTDLLVNIVSLVDYPANERMFLLQKSINGGEMKSKLDEMVKNGLITQEDATLILSRAGDSDDIAKSAKDAVDSLEKLISVLKEEDKKDDDKDDEKDKDDKKDDDVKKDDEDKKGKDVKKDDGDKKDDKDKKDEDVKKDEASDDDKKSEDDKKDDKDNDDKKDEAVEKADKEKIKKEAKEKDALVKSVADLKDEISALKKALDDKTEKDLKKDELKKFDDMPTARKMGELLREIHKDS